MITIAQNDPRAGYLACREAIDQAIERVLERGRYILGEEVEAFEKEWAAYLGAKYAIGVGSGTDALCLALRACGIGKGDEVLTVAHTAVATVAAIEQCGACPVFVDIDPRSYTMDPAALTRALTVRTMAILPVHLYGQPADMKPILAFAEQHHLWVIEDCAQAHGASYSLQADGFFQKVGTLGHVAAFSFYPTKNLGGFGDGGCVVTNSEPIAEKIRLLREYGWKDRYVSEIAGGNSRLDELQAAVLRVKLGQLEDWNRSRRTLAAVYESGLDGIICPARVPGRASVYHQFVIQVEGRERLRGALEEAGIGTAIHYPVPIHWQPAYAHYRERFTLPVTEAVCSRILSLPMYPQLGVGAAKRVVEEIALATERGSRQGR